MRELVLRDAERYAEAHTTAAAGVLSEIASWTLSETAAPGMMSGLVEARVLEALIVVGGARRVLEIGTFTGFGALSMAEAVGECGEVVTLEVNEDTAATARRHIAASPVGDRVKLVVGDALETLDRLDGPFDLCYIDAWKADYPAYYDAVVPLLSERGVVVADNLFRDGDTLDPGSADPGTVGMREFADRVQADPRVRNALLTVGDGLMVAWRVPGS